KEPIPRAEAWRIARIMTGLVVAVNLALMAAFFPVLSQILSAVPIWAFALVFAILMGLAFLANRFFLTMGANAVLKAQARVKK
ncbi:MAG: ABZJ_00895 family protein, partial [Pseudomonadota bacterium]